jgi:hypothetical protein
VPPKAKEKIQKRRTANSKQARKEIQVPNQIERAQPIHPESPQHAPNP